VATPGLGRLAKAAAGIDRRRQLPRFNQRPARRLPVTGAEGRPVVVWVDSFTDTLDAARLAPLLTVLAAAGFAPTVLRSTTCCGLPWITTGQRDHAAHLLRRSLEVLHPLVAAGTPVVGLEPSCVAVWRSDAAELVDDPRVAVVASGIHTLAELLTEASWEPPDLTGTVVVAQPHCHHSAVIGWAADERLLARTGATVVKVAGCCGLAGNFGVERGHYETSVAVANTHLLPAVDAAGPDAVLLADGFSCRLQLADLAGREALTLAELLARPRTL
jgi:Fe-S oxidoreductase